MKHLQPEQYETSTPGTWVGEPKQPKTTGEGRPRASKGKRVADASDILAEPDMLRDSLGYAIQRARVRAYEMLFATYGKDTISPARMTALSLIGAQPGTNQSALAEQLRITRASIVKVIDNLEALGLVERRAIEGDRRSYSLVLTEKGQQELRNLHEKTRQYEKRLAEALTTDERALLMSLLERVAISSPESKL